MGEDDRVGGAGGSRAGEQGQSEAFKSTFWVFIMSPTYSTEGV